MPTGRLRRTARGVVSLLTTVFVATLGLTLLVSVDIGNVFFTQRALQRAADMAALAAAQRLDIATQAAQQSVTQNGLSVTPAVVLGVWNATNTAAAPTYFCASGSTGCTGTVNAAQVTLSQNVPYFFSVGQRTLTATAIAKNTAIVSFSLGSGLASVNNGLLNQLLGALLGNSNPLSLDLVSYQGLANTNIRLSDLMASVGVGTVSQLLTTQLSLSRFFDAVITAGNQNGLTGVSAGTVLAPNTLALGPGLSNTAISIGNSSSTPGVLQLLSGVGNDQSALNTQLNVLDLLMTAAQIANSQNATTVSTNLGLPGVAGLPGPVNVGLTLKIIQPPVIAIGPAGTDASGNWLTTAKTGQVSLGLNVVTSVVGAINMTIPIGLIAAGANAHLEAAHCPVPRSGLSADFGGQVTPVSLCIASGSATAASSVSSYVCPVTPAPLVQVQVPLLGTTTAASLSATINPQAASNWTPDPTTVMVGQTVRVSGTSGFFGSILNSNLSQVQLTVASSPIVSAVLSTLGITQTLLATTLGLVGQTLDTVLTPLLSALGIQLGYADIKVLSVNCDAVELVF